MKDYQIIEITSLIVWLTVPIIYRRHDKFYFFLFLGLIDLVAQILWKGLSISVLYAWIPFHYLMLIGFNRKLLLKNIKIKLLGLVPILVINPFLSYHSIKSCILVFHIIFFLLFVRLLLSQFVKNNNTSYFLIVIIIYECIMLVRLIAPLRDIRLGVDISYLGAAIQIFIGILLIIMQLWKNKSEAVTAQ